jgi:hypothetical protein
LPGKCIVVLDHSADFTFQVFKAAQVLGLFSPYVECLLGFRGFSLQLLGTDYLIHNAIVHVLGRLFYKLHLHGGLLLDLDVHGRDLVQ